jgi:hypothetical protein
VKVVARIIVALALPTLVFIGGASLMSRWTNHQLVRERLARNLPDNPQPLNMRFGYDVATARAVWSSLDNPAAQDSEQQFLKFDLVFPLVYGAGLAAGLLLAWGTANRPVNPAWLIALVGITIVADWTENLTQLQQLRQFIVDQRLDAGSIAVASAATIVKLTFFVASAVGIVILAVVALYRLSQQRTVAD